MTDERRNGNEREQTGWTDRAPESAGVQRSAGSGGARGGDERGSPAKPALTDREKRERWPIG